MIDVIREAWGWTGLDPVRIETTNAFGNVVVEDATGRFWRVCPEDLSCKIIASDRESYKALWADLDFVRDLEMTLLVQEAARLLGSLPADRSYCLKIPAVLGGKYDGTNFGTIKSSELISSSGSVAKQLTDLPDGTTVKFKIID